jgi:CRISPR/Cas system CSM-associated protein Csm2 small subunit
MAILIVFRPFLQESLRKDKDDTDENLINQFLTVFGGSWSEIVAKSKRVWKRSLCTMTFRGA